MSWISASLLRRSLRVPISSAPFLRRGRPPWITSSLLADSSPLSPLSSAAAPQGLKPASSFLSLRFASSKVSGDENLRRVIDSEIQGERESDTHGQKKLLIWVIFIQQESIAPAEHVTIQGIHEVDVPEDLPFEIVDNPGDQAVFLKREFAGENIQVTVLMNFDEQNDLEESDEDDDDDERNENSMEPTLSLVVTIDKGEGSLLEFCCNVNSDELEIESMVMKKRDDVDGQSAYQGPKFSDLDENLQEALHRYLEARGIKSSLFDVLHKYMMNKDEREYLGWLKNMKGLIAS
ncbi:Mitochondrial glycoprotein [Musa troglodytarum]|uniref:Mitochondrial glycoprotein n=1 Tax=Musa troglodytarum TaxID=320322 RepID=A0A9E7FRU3_9LILI|nr:Mitochondrial glycoprotein [Musa troglodytarum]